MPERHREPDQINYINADAYCFGEGHSVSPFAHAVGRGEDVPSAAA